MAKKAISVDSLVLYVASSAINFYTTTYKSTWSNEPEHTGSLVWFNPILGFRINSYSYSEKAIIEYLEQKGITVHFYEDKTIDAYYYYITYEAYINLITLLKLKENSHGT